LTDSEQVIDNSGALLVECVNVLKQKVNNGWGGVGDEIVCVVKRARPVSAAAQASSVAVKVRKGDVRRAVIVRTKKAVRRPDGRLIRFDDNAAVLLNNKRDMLGTRIGGVVSADLRMKGWGKIVSLAPKVRDSRKLFPGTRLTSLGRLIHRNVLCYPSAPTFHPRHLNLHYIVCKPSRPPNHPVPITSQRPYLCLPLSSRGACSDCPLLCERRF